MSNAQRCGRSYWVELDLDARPGSPCAGRLPRPELSETLPGDPLAGRVLRLALAMKGGVSLAVWIGGGVAEIDVFRRIRVRRVGNLVKAYVAFAVPESVVLSGPIEVAKYRAEREPLFARAGIYARALRARGFDEVEVDILAGASAGGLNAVLYSVAQRVGADVDALLTTWLGSGALAGLLWTPGTRRVESALAGDAGFWMQVDEALYSLRDGAKIARHADLCTDNLVVELSATLIDPDLDDDPAARDGRGHLRFVARPGDDVLGRAIPGYGTDERSMDDRRRLAYAARTTSSFPGAFEPALITSVADRTELVGGGQVDMSAAFAAHRLPSDADKPYRVMDGGVLDNVPIERVLRSIRRQPVTRYSTRSLVLLDPTPDDPRGSWRAPEEFIPANTWGWQPRTRRDVVSRFRTVVGLALRKRQGRENTADELDQVESLRQTLYLAQGRDEGLGALLQSVDAGTAAFDAWSNLTLRAYVRYRATADYAYLSQVFSSPDIWQLGTDLNPRRRWNSIAAAQLSRLNRCLLRRYQEAAADPAAEETVTYPAVVWGPQAEVDALTVAISWLRGLENVAWLNGQLNDFGSLSIPAGYESTAALRADLHAERTAALLRRDNRVADVLTAVQSAGVEAPPDQVANFAIKAWVGEVPTGSSPGWISIDHIVDDLRARTTWLSDVAGAGDAVLQGWTDLPWSAPITRSSSLRGWHLGPVYAAHGMPDSPDRLAFRHVSSADGATFPERSRLETGRRRAVLNRLMTWSPTQIATVDPKWVAKAGQAAAKLAGSEVAHFGAFFSGRWRQNDWWWGRLDASAGMLRLLEDHPAPPYPVEVEVGPSAFDIESAQRLVRHQMDSSSQRPYQEPVLPPGAPLADADNDDLIQRRMSHGTDAIADLPAGYRLAIASRLVRVLSRAAVHGSKTLNFLAVLLRPLLLLIPLLVDPPRAILGAGALVGSTFFVQHAVLGAARTDAPLANAGAGLIALVVLALALTAIGPSPQWRAIVEARLDLRQSGARARSNWVRGLCVAAGVACAVLSYMSFLAFGFDVLWLALVITGVIFGFTAHRMKGKVVGTPRPVRVVRWIAGSIGGLAAVALAVVAEATAGLLSSSVGQLAASPVPPKLYLAGIVGVTGFVLALVLTYGWTWAFVRQWRAWAMAAVWIPLAALSGVVASAIVGTFLLLLPEWTEVWGGPWLFVLAYFAWGTAVWWLGEWPLAVRYTPSDEPQSR